MGEKEDRALEARRQKLRSSEHIAAEQRAAEVSRMRVDLLRSQAAGDDSLASLELEIRAIDEIDRPTVMVADPELMLDLITGNGIQ